ncbi:MAG: hypothetical protein LBD08_01130, partial [Treponema sp.]|jgi:hypothetical protein|nr:hypothetical protein [Treponema sp.]
MIIEYTDDGKPAYYEYDQETFQPVGDPVEPLGNFRAVYLTNISESSMEISATADSTDSYSRSEKETLAAAKTAFTLDKLDTYVTMPSAYAKQQ